MLTLYESNISSNVFLSEGLRFKKFKNDYSNSRKMHLLIKKFCKMNTDIHCNNPIIKNGSSPKLFDNVIVKKVNKDCKVKGIIGQKGVFTKNNIFLPKDCILGLFNGTRYTKDEYIEFGSTKFKNYAMKTCNDVIIDPTHPQMILKYINDGRKDINRIDSCKKYFNVEALEIVIHNIPSIIVYTIDFINPNHQLFMDYGDRYWNIRNKNDYV